MKLTIKDKNTREVIKEIEFEKTSDIDLSFADLREADLRGVNLRKVNFMGAK